MMRPLSLPQTCGKTGFGTEQNKKDIFGLNIMDTIKLP